MTGALTRGAGADVVLVVHGTRLEVGAVAARHLARRLGERLGEHVRLAFADVRGPDVTDTLRALPRARPAVVLPAFLAAGYHVRTDVPEQIRRSGRAGVRLAAPLGPDPLLLDALADRVAESGGDPRRDALVLAAAGSSRPAARAEVQQVATALADRLDCGPIPVAWAAPDSVPETVAAARALHRRRVAVATWLLAPGLFADRVAAAGADSAAAPLGVHPAVLDVLLKRLADC